MSNRAQSFPFRRIPPQLVAGAQWQSLASGASGPLTPELPHWDYNVDLRLVRGVTLNEAEVRQASRLRDDDPIAIAATWRSQGTNLRGSGLLVPLGTSKDTRELTLTLDISGRLLAGELVVSTQIALTGPPTGGDPLAARFPGSVLWEESTRVVLEGTGSRFPMEVVDFSSVYWAPYGAGWYLSWNRDDLQEPFLRNVRLFINASHPAVVAAVQAPVPSPEHTAIRSAVYFDVGRQLIRGALDNDEFVEAPDSFGEGTTGRAVLQLLRNHFPGDKPRALRSTMRERPEYFDGLLQGTLRLFLTD